jgi:hypothetical protein
MGNGIDQYTNNPELAAAGTEADTAANTLTQYQTASSMLPAALKNAINEKLDFNKAAIEQKNKSMTDYFNAPSQARVDYQDIFNPFQREALVQKATNNAYIPYQTNTEVLAQRLGTIQDIINSATGAFGAQVTSAQGAATAAENKYNRLFGLAGAKSDVAYKNAQLTNSDSGGNSLFDWPTTTPTTPTQQNYTPTEPEPNYSPVQGEGAKSNQGQWIYHAGEWMINVKYFSSGTTNTPTSGMSNEDIIKAAEE